MKSKPLFYSIDLEMEQPSNEILSVGYAWQNPDIFVNRTLIERKDFLITPSQPISSFITKLTGLEDSMFDHSKSRRTCFEEFLQHHANVVEFTKQQGYSMRSESVVWGCGDIKLLLDEINKEGIEYRNISRNFIDVKGLILVDNVCSGKSVSKKMSLNSALKLYGLAFDGKQHVSADDAYNTLLLFENFIDKKTKMTEHINMLKTLID